MNLLFGDSPPEAQSIHYPGNYTHDERRYRVRIAGYTIRATRVVYRSWLEMHPAEVREPHMLRLRHLLFWFSERLLEATNADTFGGNDRTVQVDVLLDTNALRALIRLWGEAGRLAHAGPGGESGMFQRLLEMARDGGENLYAIEFLLHMQDHLGRWEATTRGEVRLLSPLPRLRGYQPYVANPFGSWLIVPN